MSKTQVVLVVKKRTPALSLLKLKRLSILLVLLFPPFYKVFHITSRHIPYPINTHSAKRVGNKVNRGTHKEAAIVIVPVISEEVITLMVGLGVVGVIGLGVGNRADGRIITDVGPAAAAMVGLRVEI